MTSFRTHPPDRAGYQTRLFGGLPIFSTRLVRECDISYCDRHQVRTPADVALLLRPYFADRDREEIIALLLDTGGSVIGLAQISIGGRRTALCEPDQILKAAILANAEAIILAHNHPSGNAIPSPEDVAATKRLVEAGRFVGVSIHDHLIVTVDGYTSLAERGLLQ